MSKYKFVSETTGKSPERKDSGCSAHSGLWEPTWHSPLVPATVQVSPGATHSGSRCWPCLHGAGFTGLQDARVTQSWSFHQVWEVRHCAVGPESRQAAPTILKSELWQGSKKIQITGTWISCQREAVGSMQRHWVSCSRQVHWGMGAPHDGPGFTSWTQDLMFSLWAGYISFWPNSTLLFSFSSHLE